MASKTSEDGTTSKEAAIKARIIKHMNTEHAESLSLYLRYHSGLSAPAAANPKLTDMTYSSLTIASSNGASHDIPLEPPMTSWSDVRPRVIAMDSDARTALGLPPLPSSPSHSQTPKPPSSSPVRVTVTAYDPPTAPLHIFMIALVAFFYSCYFLRRAGRILVPGTWYWEHVMAHFPAGGAEGYAWLQERLAVPVVLLHGAETGVMVWRLAGHGVRVGTGLWWKWVGATFLEGAGAHQRFGGVLKRGGGEGGKRKGS
jgi:hypothetical protein